MVGVISCEFALGCGGEVSINVLFQLLVKADANSDPMNGYDLTKDQFTLEAYFVCSQ